MFHIEHVIVIIGAGICGLAAGYELSRRGQQAIVFERGERLHVEVDVDVAAGDDLDADL